jgi:hypothetical protein
MTETTHSVSVRWCCMQKMFTLPLLVPFTFAGAAGAVAGWAFGTVWVTLLLAEAALAEAACIVVGAGFCAAVFCGSRAKYLSVTFTGPLMLSSRLQAASFIACFLPGAVPWAEHLCPSSVN